MRKNLLILPVLALILGGCSSIPFLNKAVETVQQTAEEKAAEQAILKDCKFDKDACAYMATAATTMSKPLIMKTSSGGGSESQTIMDGTGNMQMISSKAGVEESNMIILDGDTYTKDYKANVWMLYKADKTGEQTSLIDPETIAEDFKEKFEIEEDDYVMKRLGEENCGEPAPNLTCFKYETYMSKSPTDKTLVWFDTRDHLARRMDTSYNETTSSITYYYDNVPAIVKPSPVKEFEMPKLPEGAAGQMPTQAEIDKMMEQFSNDSGE